MSRNVLLYDAKLKETARHLRKNMTESERMLWSRLRRKQIMGVQFYRQKPIGYYIVDFYAPKVNLVIEVDGSQHKEAEHEKKDKRRDGYLSSRGIEVLRFKANEVIRKIDAVSERIYEAVKKRIGY